MVIRPIERAEHEGFLAFLEAGMRPDGAATHLADDFPIALGLDNLAGMYGCWDGDDLVAGLAILVRRCATSLGAIQVAGIGSVVTRPDRRGRGLSRDLQEAVLADLRRQEVPLAVLWSDQPEIYAHRGFRAAGWETHVDLRGADLDGFLPAAAAVRPFVAADTGAVGRLYACHPWATVREPGDDAALYGMRGTRGLVYADASGSVQAYAFAGKGADFPDYVAEWGGPSALVAAVLARLVRGGWAHRVLVPQGGEPLIDLLDQCGAARAAAPSGLWTVLTSLPLERAFTQVAGRAAAMPASRDDPGSWLGFVTEVGDVVPGPLSIAIWGLDSV